MQRYAASLGRWRVSAARVALAAALALPAAPLSADILHLASGGVVEGEILEQGESGYRVKTTFGTVVLARDAVVRIEAAPSPFDEYQQRLESTGDSAAQHYELAMWCEQRGLTNERRKHLARATELDYDFAPARAALGHVRVGQLWVDARTPSDRARKPDAARDQDALVTAVQSQWFIRVRAVRDTLLENNDPVAVAQGQDKIDEISDPLAIVPMSEVLGRGARVSREALIRALSRFSEDEATLNLAVLALVDPERDLRAMALGELARRNDARVGVQFRRALLSDNDLLIRRGAEACGALRVQSAVPALIDALKVQRRRVVEVPLSRYFDEWTSVYNNPRYIVVAGNSRVAYVPRIGVAAAGAFINPETRYEARDVTVYRTEALEALKQITGQNFGFDETAWRRWNQEQKP